MSKRVKIFAIIVLVITVIIFIASKTGSSNTDTGSLSSTMDTALPITNVEPSTDNEFSALLSTVTSISIDDSIFNSPAYKALRDNPVTLGSDIVGRTNPFAPIGADSSGDIITPIVQTLQPGKVTSTTAEFSAQVSFTTTAPVSVIFQYGVNDQLGSVTTPTVLSKSGTVLATVRNLSPNTIYQVKAIAVVGSTTANGNTMSFSTTSTPSQ
jgi:hypothetical protein